MQVPVSTFGAWHHLNMLLAIDVGNTNIVVGAYDRKRLLVSGRITTDSPRTVDEYAMALEGLLERLEVPPEAISRILIVSVVPKATAGVKAALKGLCRPKPQVAGEDLRIPIRNLYKDPRQVGRDRLVNAVAARAKFGAPVIVADFGTAITVDVVSRAGAYLGGMIAPGLEISLEALVGHAALLPRVDLATPQAVLGRDTATSMQSGLVYGYGALCDGLVNRLKTEVKVRRLPVVATGGHAAFISPYCRTVTHVDPTLTLDGLALLAK